MISDLEGITIEIIQNETSREKTKSKFVICGTTLSTLIYLQLESLNVEERDGYRKRLKK